MPGKTEYQGLEIEWLGHGAVGVYKEKAIYIDPFSEVLSGKERSADLIVSTHEHWDHFDTEAINTLSSPETRVFVKSGTDTSKLKSRFVTAIEVNEIQTIEGIELKAVHAYNNKRFRSPGTPFHPKGTGMGILLKIQGSKLYYAGDTDLIDEMQDLRGEGIDIAFFPIGGKFTMDLDEAVEAARVVKPKVVIPVHYNHLKGTEADPEEFKTKVEESKDIKVIVL